ncbi:hypothetical protein GEV33_008029 [Tenebrio molitor]|uniref:Uncharacterized protein n=1 Tax=Tenebrio molitor TaxID=7067 RepID=A0A8J6LCK6_TENMO|nr:hypothetical protein GEV33_008029 [Tenebrio molitor]
MLNLTQSGLGSGIPEESSLQPALVDSTTIPHRHLSHSKSPPPMTPLLDTHKRFEQKVVNFPDCVHSPPEITPRQVVCRDRECIPRPDLPVVPPGLRSVVADFMGKSGGSEGGVGGLRSPTFELGEQTAPRTMACGRGREWGLRASMSRPCKVDGEPVFGPQRLGEQTAPRSSRICFDWTRDGSPFRGPMRGVRSFLLLGKKRTGKTAVLAPKRAFRQTTQSHRSVGNGRRGSQFMCGTKEGGKPIGLAGALPRERTLSGNVYTLIGCVRGIHPYKICDIPIRRQKISLSRLRQHHRLGPAGIIWGKFEVSQTISEALYAP